MALVIRNPSLNEVIRNTVSSYLTSWVNNTVGTYDAVRQCIWSNQWKVDPQVVLDAVGTDGAELIALLDKMNAAIKAVVAKSEADALAPTVPEDKTVTTKPDGTVTVSAKIAVG